MSTQDSQRGRFISVEGIEGVGKTTNIAYLKARIEQAGYQLVQTREPGGTVLAEQVRDILLTPREDVISTDAELLLVFAARAQHIASVIEPALARGQWVLSDRFTDATYAYQGAGRGIDISRIAQLEAFVQDGLCPDVTFLLDASVDVGLSRAQARSAPDRIESEKAEFFERVRQGYLLRVAGEPSRFAKIDAAQPLVHVQAQIDCALKQKLGF